MANIYVATDGDDDNDGTSPSSADAWATWRKAANNAVAGDTVYFVVRSLGDVFSDPLVGVREEGTIQINYVSEGNSSSGPTQWRGANSAGEVDGTIAVFDFDEIGVTSNEGAIHVTSDYHFFENIAIHNSSDSGWRVDSTVTDIVWLGCEAHGCSVAGFYCTGGSTATSINCYASGNQTGFQASTANGQVHHKCIALDNTNHGFNLGMDAHCYFCISARNGGDGFFNASQCINCVAYSNSGDGISKGDEANFALYANNIISNNTLYGYNPLDEANQEPAMLVNNAMGNNGSGDYNGSINDKYDIEIGKVTLASDPFVNASINNFTLNNRPDGGVLCRGAGTSFVHQTGVHNVLDIGAIQSQRTIVSR
jgi:hypothetical protein